MKMFNRLSAILLLALCCGVSAVQAQELKPLSAADRARVDELLKSFDPNSYSFTYDYVGPAGKVHKVQVGGAKGLANLRQSNTVRRVPEGAAAGTNQTINIFREAAGTNQTINIFREAASLGVTINLFKDPNLNSKARELNAILQRYYVQGPRELQTPNVRRPQ